MKSRDWTIATSAIIVLLCLMSWLDDGYDVQVAANQDLIEAQTAARLELADRQIERDYLTAKAENMTGLNQQAAHEHKVEVMKNEPHKQ